MKDDLPVSQTVSKAVSQTMSQPDTAAMQVVKPSSRQRQRQAGSREGKPVTSFPASPIRIYVMRFDPLRAAGLQTIFEHNSGIEIIVEEPSDQAGNGWLDPTIKIVLIGSQLGPGTQNLIVSIRSARPEVAVILMSPASGDEAILGVLRLGAKGFIHEVTSPEQFEEAIQAVAGGSIWAPRRLQAELINRLLASDEPQPSTAKLNFTGREQEVLNLLLDGRSNREIAGSLKIEERTVKSYVTRLLRKTSVKNRTALSMLAMSAKANDPSAGSPL